MSLGNMTLAFAPLFPWAAIAVLAAIATISVVIGIWRGASATVLRALVAAILLLALANPRIENENREARPDVAFLVIDETSSQKAGNRKAQLAEAVKEVRKRLERFAELDVVDLRVKETEEGSFAFEDINRALADVPTGRFAGAVMITDGQIHDAPREKAKSKAKSKAGSVSDQADRFAGAPLHLLLTGSPDEKDRRLIVERAPAFGIVGKQARISLRVQDRPGTRKRRAKLTVRLADGEPYRTTAPIGRSATITVPIEHGGPTIVEIEAEPLAGEMSLVNNRALVTINGVRDRLKVLLISGQPHAGERTWRNLLKSDPSVDLVHFTILRPPDKSDFTPLNELALIAFPIRELFEIKLHEFDLVIFDRYVVRFLLPPNYFRNIEEYVHKGGAVLATVGPDFATLRSLFHTPLGGILPGAPTGEVSEGGFRAAITGKGLRHPVTADLVRGPKDAARWGRWFRLIEANARSGHVLLEGAGHPLLILDRVEKGRVAQFMSDHIWLWARGFEGGGPHAELLRRLSHWLMKEPELEEEDLRLAARGTRLTIERRSLTPDNLVVTVEAPSGAKELVTLSPGKKGIARAEIETKEMGLYRARDGRRTALTVVGQPNAPELADLRASGERLAPLVKATGGATAWISQGIPDFRRVKPGRNAHSHGWMGMVRSGAYVVVGVRQVSLLPALLLLVLAAGGLMLAWWREGR